MVHERAGNVSGRRAGGGVGVGQLLLVDELLVDGVVRAAELLGPGHGVPALVDKLFDEFLVVVAGLLHIEVPGSDGHAVAIKALVVPVAVDEVTHFCAKCLIIGILSIVHRSALLPLAPLSRLLPTNPHRRPVAVTNLGAL